MTNKDSIVVVVDVVVIIIIIIKINRKLIGVATTPGSHHKQKNHGAKRC